MTWLIGLCLIGWLTLPLARLVFVSFPDGGLAAGRILAIALISLLSMWLAVTKVAPLSLAPLWFVVGPIACAATVLGQAGRRRDFLEWMKGRLPALLLSEVVFIVTFLFFLWIRLRHPEINDLEKPMDAAIMGVLTHADALPADNPWWSGLKFTNYYYFGHLMGALLARTFLTPIAYAYNLVLPAFSALFLAALWSLCAAVTGCRWRGLAATAMVGLLGHFEPLRQLVTNGKPWPLNWWDTSRVIKDTINEYPMFTMTIGDAHAHFFALSLGILVFCLCWALLNGSRDGPSNVRHRLVTLVLLGQVLGILVMTNTWDVPTYGLLAVGCAVTGMRLQGLPWQRHLAWSFLPLALALPVAWPYLRTFHSQVSGVQLELWSPPALSFYLLWAGFLTLFLLTLLFLDRERRYRSQLLAALLAIPVALLLRWPLQGFAERVGPLRQVSELLDRIVLPVVLGALISTGLLGYRMVLEKWRGPDAPEGHGAVADPDDQGARSGFIVLLGIVGLMVLLAPMVFYLRGVFGDSELRHQDTVFKYTQQAWLLLGTAANCGAWYALGSPGLARWRLPAAIGAVVVLSVPLLCAACVVDGRAVSGASLVVDGKAQLSLDGARHVPPDDRAAIAWLSEHGVDGDVVLEGVGDHYAFSGYNEFGRVAALSGVPSTLGWTQHVGGWNKGLDLEGRWNLVRRVYQWENTPAAMADLKQLKVRYIFIGSLERRDYDPAALARMRAALPTVTEHGQTVMLEVR